MTTEQAPDPAEDPSAAAPAESAGAPALPERTWAGPSRLMEHARLLVAVGSLTGLVLALASFGWALAKAAVLIRDLLPGGNSDQVALLKLFESLDVVLIGTVCLIIAVGLWELFVGDLNLPGSLTMRSLDDLKAKVATTLLLVLVVRFLETLVRTGGTGEVLELAIAVTLVGGLLIVFANWRR